MCEHWLACSLRTSCFLVVSCWRQDVIGIDAKYIYFFTERAPHTAKHAFGSSRLSCFLDYLELLFDGCSLYSSFQLIKRRQAKASKLQTPRFLTRSFSSSLNPSTHQRIISAPSTSRTSFMAWPCAAGRTARVARVHGPPAPPALPAQQWSRHLPGASLLCFGVNTGSYTLSGEPRTRALLWVKAKTCSKVCFVCGSAYILTVVARYVASFPGGCALCDELFGYFVWGG